MTRILRGAVAALLFCGVASAQTAPRIGQTFGAELAAAGCPSTMSWSSDGTLLVAPGVDPACATRVLAAHDPTKALPRSASAKQVRYALNDLGVRAAWNAAVAAATQSAQDYWASQDPMIEDNTKILKWCAAAGITPKALFDQAVTE